MTIQEKIDALKSQIQDLESEVRKLEREAKGLPQGEHINGIPAQYCYE